jgi:NTP pyrophosphatase (non-canonical NTP hydrolase)
MTFDEYEQKAMETALDYGDQAFNYGGLGLASEAGEVAGKLKRVIREHDNIVTEEMRDTLKKELGDVLWYINFLAVKLNIPLKDVATANIEKLSNRKTRETLKGTGDER